MNQTAEAIKSEYMGVCSTLVNQYIQLARTHPYEALERYKQIVQKFIFLVDIWGSIELSQKERKNGRI